MHLSCVRRPGPFLRAALWIESLKSLLKHVKSYDHLIPHSVSALSTPINYSDYERAASKKTKNNIYAPLGLFISNRNICRRSGASLVIKKAGAAEEFFSKSPAPPAGSTAFLSPKNCGLQINSPFCSSPLSGSFSEPKNSIYITSSTNSVTVSPGICSFFSSCRYVFLPL